MGMTIEQDVESEMPQPGEVRSECNICEREAFPGEPRTMLQGVFKIGEQLCIPFHRRGEVRRLKPQFEKGLQTFAAILLRYANEPFSSILCRTRQHLMAKRNGKRERSDSGMQSFVELLCPQPHSRPSNTIGWLQRRIGPFVINELADHRRLDDNAIVVNEGWDDGIRIKS